MPSNTKQMKSRMLKRSMDPWRDGRDESAKNITQRDRSERWTRRRQPDVAGARARSSASAGFSTASTAMPAPGNLGNDRGKSRCIEARAPWCGRADDRPHTSAGRSRASSMPRHPCLPSRRRPAWHPSSRALQIGSERARAGRIVCGVDQHRRAAGRRNVPAGRATARASGPARSRSRRLRRRA